MGLGDNLLASGMARGAASRGKRIAFGDGRTILWDQHSEQVFKRNPNVAPPGSEGAADLEWVGHYKGQRLYNRHDAINNKWVWNYDFKATPGEMFFTDDEGRFAKNQGTGFVLVEPHVPSFKAGVINKRWPQDRYEQIVKQLKARGHDVAQFASYKYGGATLLGARAIKAPSFRHALAALSRAALYIGSEGGLHHGAAAVNTNAVVIFGGWIPPVVTGYDGHINLTGGAEACGSLAPCSHCAEALLRIDVKHVWSAAKDLLNGKVQDHDVAEPG